MSPIRRNRDEPRYAAFRQLVAPAEARPGLWRLAAGIVAVGVIAFLASQAMVFAALRLGDISDPMRLLSPGPGPARPVVTLLLLGSLGFLGLATFAAARIFQKRSPGSLIGPAGPALRQGLRVFGAVAILHGLLLAAALLFGGLPQVDQNLPTLGWLALLPVSLATLLVQTGSEELFFRGYLQSQLAARFRSPIVWMVLPSALFALGHLAAAFGPNAWAVAGWAGLFGLAAADLTARSGTLGPAIALHLVNNALVLLFVSMEGPLSGLALYTLPFGPSDAEAVASALPLDYLTLVAGWVIARLAIRR